MKKILLVALSCIFSLSFTSCNKATTPPVDDTPDDENIVEQIVENLDNIENGDEGTDAGETAEKKSVWSCNTIAESSVCLEYYWSYWTAENAKLNCSDAGKFSTDPCPTGAAGGCNSWAGTEVDAVAWMYLEWGGGITQESLPYAQMACDATAGSKWVEGK